MHGYSSVLLLALSVLQVPHKVYGTTTLLLTSQPKPPGAYCPGPVTFTCVGTEIGTLFWLVDDMILATYGYRFDDEFPLTPPLNSPPAGAAVEIINALSESNLLNVTSLFNVSDVTVLNGSSVQCEEATIESEVIIVHVEDIAVPPFLSFPLCSLYPSPGGMVEVSLQWSPSFTSQYAVEAYRVSVNPDPSSCSSDQVSPSENYSCSGLVLGTRYTFTVSAINCGDQEGERNDFDIYIEGLTEPTDLEVVEIAGEQNNIVQWIQSSYVSEGCSPVGDIEYTFELVDNTGEVVEQRVNASEACSNGTCSILIPTSGTCLVRVQATSPFVNSTAELNIAGVRLTTANQALLVAGLFFLGVSIVLIIIIMAAFEKGSKVSFLLFVVGCLLVVLSLALWIAVGFQVGLQENTCDPSWQSTRDDLIIAAHVISDLAFLVEVVAVMFLCIAVWCWDNCMESTSNNKCVLKWLGPHWAKTKPIKTEDDHLKAIMQKSDLQRGAGGRVLELEERMENEHKEVGEGVIEARSRVGEERLQDYDRIERDRKLREQETTGSATPTQPSIYSRLNPLKKRGKEEGGGGHYQHLDHEKGKREDKVNDHKNPLPSPEEYGTLETPSPAGDVHVPNSRDVPKGANGSGEGDKKEETSSAPTKPPRSPAAQPHTTSSKGTGQGNSTVPESKPHRWSLFSKPNTSSSSGTGSVTATGMHLPATKTSSSEGEGSATAAGSKSGLARNIPAPDSVDGAVEDKARSKQIETDYKNYAKHAPRGKMSLELDEEHGGEDTHLERISEYFAEDWDTTVAPALGLTEEEIKRIKKKHKGKSDLQKRQALKMWKDREGPNATYENLLRLLLTCEKRLCASVLSKLWS